jgi:hypothetical protein
VLREKAMTSYEEAKASCIAKVDAIVRECKRLNQKYYDRMFNLPGYDTLVSMGADEDPSSVGEFGVGAVKRIEVSKAAMELTRISFELGYFRRSKILRG